MSNANTVFNKGFSDKVKKHTNSIYNTRKLKKALMHINDAFPKPLCESIKVSKLNSSQYPNLYVYKASNNVRILFSIDNNTKIVHDIISIKDIKNLWQKKR